MILVRSQRARPQTIRYWVYASLMTVRFFFLMGLGATGLVDWFAYLLYGTPKPLILLPIGLFVGVLACVFFILSHFILFLSENNARKTKIGVQKVKGANLDV